MDTSIRVAAASVALTTFALVGIAGCSKTDTAATTGTAAPTTIAAGASSTTAKSTGSPPAAGGAGVVTVKTFTFKPSPVTVKAGETIIWTNEDDILHEPTAGEPGKPGDAFKTVSLDGKGSTGTATIAQAGSYKYFCAVHESMVGEIAVT